MYFWKNPFSCRICDQTHKDIMDIERKRIKTNREISNITRELMMTKNPLDIKILSERVMAIKVRHVTPRFGRTLGCFYSCARKFFAVFKILLIMNISLHPISYVIFLLFISINVNVSYLESTIFGGKWFCIRLAWIWLSAFLNVFIFIYT